MENKDASMTVEQALQKKRELISKLFHAIAEYESETGLPVCKIDVYRGSFGGGQFLEIDDSTLFHVDVEVKLP